MTQVTTLQRKKQGERTTLIVTLAKKNCTSVETPKSFPSENDAAHIYVMGSVIVVSGFLCVFVCGCVYLCAPLKSQFHHERGKFFSGNKSLSNNTVLWQQQLRACRAIQRCTGFPFSEAFIEQQRQPQC